MIDIAFGRVALGGGLLAFDDHPGQLYRLYHAVALGWTPWRLNPGWRAGYAELQYYPPGAAWLGAALHQGSSGIVGVPAEYQAVLWIAWLLPGMVTFAPSTRVLGGDRLALLGAFAALTLSAGARNGVEKGLRWGLVAALALGLCGFWLLPLLAHLDLALPLAWGAASALGLLRQLATRPLVIVLALTQLGCWLSIRSVHPVPAASHRLHAFTPAMALVVAFDALLAAPLGVLLAPGRQARRQPPLSTRSRRSLGHATACRVGSGGHGILAPYPR